MHVQSQIPKPASDWGNDGNLVGRAGEAIKYDKNISITAKAVVFPAMNSLREVSHLQRPHVGCGKAKSNTIHTGI